MSSTQAAPGSKLRNSCDPCSLAKVGCEKGKPTCKRCEKRGLSCVYGATKRAGRTSHSKQLQKQQQQQHQHQHQQQMVAPASMASSTTVSSSLSTQVLDNIASSSITPPGHAFPLPLPDFNQTTNASFSPAFSDIFATMIQQPGSSTLTPTTSSVDLDELMASVVSPPQDFPGFDMEPVFDFGTIDGFNDPDDVALLSLTDNNSIVDSLTRNNSNDSSLFPQLPQSDQLVAPPTPRSSNHSIHGSTVGCPTPTLATTEVQPTEVQPRRASVPVDAPCSCLKRALHLVALHSISINPEQCTQNMDGSLQPIKIPEFERVVQQNEQTVEEVGAILKCPCSNDGYLLVVLSLIVFSILSWYTAAAGATSRADMAGETWISEPIVERSSRNNDGEDQARLDAQLVLSKLHAVQRLVNLLANRLQCFEDARHGDGTVEGRVEALGHVFRPPFSGHLLRILEADMRRRLRELSRAIVARLRNGW